MLIHITPNNDDKKHTRSQRCKCSPAITTSNSVTVVRHKSYDGREEIERRTGHQTPNKDWTIK